MNEVIVKIIFEYKGTISYTNNKYIRVDFNTEIDTSAFITWLNLNYKFHHGLVQLKQVYVSLE